MSLTEIQRSDQIAEWVRITDELLSVSVQHAPKPQGGRPEAGVNRAAREIGVETTAAKRAIKVAGLTKEAKKAALPRRFKCAVTHSIVSFVSSCRTEIRRSIDMWQGSLSQFSGPRVANPFHIQLKPLAWNARPWSIAKGPANGLQGIWEYRGSGVRLYVYVDDETNQISMTGQHRYVSQAHFMDIGNYDPESLIYGALLVGKVVLSIGRQIPKGNYAGMVLDHQRDGEMGWAIDQVEATSRVVNA